MKRILLTGPTGFIGTHILRRLLREQCELHVVNRSGVGSPQAGVSWHQADLRVSEDAVRLVAEIKPTHLLHNAWEATPRLYAQSPENKRWLDSSLAMVAAFGAHGGRRFVGMGSSAEYDPGDVACVEDETPIRPSTPYGQCKAACWTGVQAAAGRFGFSAAWGRLFLPYGPGDPSQRLIPTLLAAFREGRTVPTTHGRQLRDFIFAPDAADLIVELLHSEEPGAFNVGTGDGSTIRSVIEYLADRCGRPDLPRFGALEPPAGEPLVLVADRKKVRERLVWRASTSIQEGLDRVLSAGQ